MDGESRGGTEPTQLTSRDSLAEAVVPWTAVGQSGMLHNLISYGQLRKGQIPTSQKT